jgi:hypothetical protein
MRDYWIDWTIDESVKKVDDDYSFIIKEIKRKDKRKNVSKKN